MKVEKQRKRQLYRQLKKRSPENTESSGLLSGEGGTVSTQGGTYDEGTEVTITATPDEVYLFSGWEGVDGESTTLTITLNSNLTLEANFELYSEQFC